MLNLKVGDEYLCEYTYTAISSQDNDDNTKKLRKTHSYSIIYKVLKQNSDSTFYINGKYKNYTIVLNNDTVIHNTNSTNYTKYNKQVNNFNKGFNFEITKKSKINLIDSITFSNYFENNNTNKTKSEIKELLSLTFVKLPETKFNIGKSWENKVDTTKTEILNIFNKKYTLKNIDKENIEIEENAKISSNNTKAKKVKSLFIFYNLKGEHKGMISLNNKSFFLKEANYTEFVIGNTEVKYSKNSGTIFSTKMLINNSIHIKTTKIN